MIEKFNVPHRIYYSFPDGYPPPFQGGDEGVGSVLSANEQKSSDQAEFTKQGSDQKSDVKPKDKQKPKPQRGLRLVLRIVKALAIAALILKDRSGKDGQSTNYP